MVGKGKDRADDDLNPEAAPPPRSSSTPGGPTDSPSTGSRARQVLRKPIQKAAGVIDAAQEAARKAREGSQSRPSVRIRRAPSSSSINQQPAPIADANTLHDIPEESTGRRRSSSEPHRPSWFSSPNAGDRLARMSTVDEMPPVPENQQARSSLRAPRNIAPQLSEHLAPHLASGDPEVARQLAAHLEPHTQPYLNTPRSNIFRRMSNAAQNRFSSSGQSDTASINVQINGQDEYDSEMVDLLDVIDPEVSTLSTLTNVQNSLFIPNLGRLINRRPTYNLTRKGTAGTFGSRPPTAEPLEEPEPMYEKDTEDSSDTIRPRLTHTSTISSTLSESRYAVLPHGESLRGWTPEEKAELNDLVRHMLHSKRAAFKRGMKGFGQYVRRPLGFFVTLYAFLITMFGLAWVLFLIGWISVGSRKDYLVNVVDNVLVALFAIMGDGLIPFRTVDTYHMIYIAHYHHLTWKLRRKKNLPKLENRNDLPAKPIEDDCDIETAAVDPELRREYRGTFEVSVLSPAQQKKLQHHQAKFAKSHTFYKPHETETHHAFPLRILVAIVVLLDFHSVFQVALGACTWGISYKVRPFALTTVILCCSIACNITGGILISVGDKRTRKKDVIEKMFRQELTHSAMKAVRKRRLKQNDEVADSDQEVPPVHVPPPLLQEEMKEKEEQMKDETIESATGTRRESKNHWRYIPKLPVLMRKEDQAIEEQLEKKANA